MSPEDTCPIKVIARKLGLGDSEIELICDHANTTAVTYRLRPRQGQEVFALKTENRPGGKVRAEARFLKANANLPFLPRVLYSGTVNFCDFYLMEYLDGYVSYSEVYRNNRLTKVHLEKVLHILQTIKTTVKSGPTVRRVFERHYIARLGERLKYLRQSFLSAYLDPPYISVNGRAFENLNFFWKRIADRLRGPFFTELGPYPGDTHFENILLRNDEELKIIDPNGASQLPLAYDLGKLLHSLHGGYDVFHALKFLARTKSETAFELRYDFPKCRTDLFSFFIASVVEKWGLEMLKHAYLSEIFHFSCLISHHLKNENEALGFYLRTLQLIDEYKEYWPDG